MPTSSEQQVRRNIENAQSESAFDQAVPDPWLRNWSEGMCEFTHDCPGPNCLQCRKDVAVKALSSPSGRVAHTLVAGATVGRRLFGL